MGDHEKLLNPGHENNMYIFGRSSLSTDGLLSIGRFQALDASLGSPVYMDVIRPHICLICGKRGYGKSYTMGVLLEEMAKQPVEVKENICAIVIDSLGIFWSMKYPNNRQNNELDQWNLIPEGFSLNLFCPNPQTMVRDNDSHGIKPLSIATEELSPLHWCHLFQVGPTDPAGMILSKIILRLRKKGMPYTIQDMIEELHQISIANDLLKGVVENLLHTAESWHIFKKHGLCVHDFFNQNTINIVDLSAIDHDYLKSIIISIISDKLFQIRINARKDAELEEIGVHHSEKQIPMIWLAIDEAQIFLPKNEQSHSKKILIDRWMRQGRQPGLSLILATQKPSLLDSEVFSHADLVFCHRLTAEDDIQSLHTIQPTYFQGNIKEYIKKIGKEKGVALVIDDTRETIHYIKIRPRQSWHGGQEPTVIAMNAM